MDLPIVCCWGQDWLHQGSYSGEMVLRCSILLFQARVYYIFVGVAGLALGQSNDLPTYFVNNILHNSTASLSLFFNGFFCELTFRSSIIRRARLLFCPLVVMLFNFFGLSFSLLTTTAHHWPNPSVRLSVCLPLCVSVRPCIWCCSCCCCCWLLISPAGAMLLYMACPHKNIERKNVYYNPLQKLNF